MKKKVMILGLTLTLATSAFAASKGGDSGGGGDALESRVNEIRIDILNWIQKGGAKELNLPNDISYSEYANKMMAILQNKKVALSFTYDPVKVQGAEKTCKGSFVITKSFFSESKSIPLILCNISRFKDTEDSKQYSLIHHEYAGLVNIEKNEGKASDCEISMQLTDFLEEKVVKKLAVKKKLESKDDTSIDPQLESITLKYILAFNFDESLEECRKYYPQLIENSNSDFEQNHLKVIKKAIKEYYKKNNLDEIENINIHSKNIHTSGTNKVVTYLVDISAGSDTAQFLLQLDINGKLKQEYYGSIRNYVDKLGRVKSRQLYCSVQKQLENNNYFGNQVKVSLINVDTNFIINLPNVDNLDLDSLYILLYKKVSLIKKDL